ncbi:hypothetical protein [Lysinibacillus sp. G4S2]|uniref:hypothetical protein n=1 Tax=Lysinibacillus sp. G4S2 TaxID=3055859 RepID=UPI0025A2D1C9|nr:hypothetical protein [Lysinibacillus sp. G4S2]MDM5246434.1 hypothetical protein [Lysinibacillus sp. G4S2]
MNKVNNHKKPIKKKPFVKSSQPSSTSTDSVNENEQLTIIDHTTLVETEELKLNETQKAELETLELQSNMATETAADEKANLETASSELPSNAEPETPMVEEDSTSELPEPATNESKEEQQPEEPSLDDAIKSTESTVSIENTMKASKQVEPDSLERDDTLLDEAVASTPNTTKHRQMNAPLTVVNHKNGKRVKIGKEVCVKLQLADGDLVDVFVKHDTVLVCKSLNAGGHNLNKGCFIYNKDLVEMITDACGLNFEGKSSNSLTQVKYVQSQGRKVAVFEKGSDIQ